MFSQNFEVVLQKYQELKQGKIPFVQATLVNSVGSAPQEQGARCLVTSQGLYFGTVGGGKIEAAVIRRAQQLLQEKNVTTFFQEWNLQKDLGMSCGGVVAIYFEVSKSENNWPIAVFGAGHVAQELIPLLLKLECEVVCIDSRQDWLAKLPKKSNLTAIYDEKPGALVAQLNPLSFVVVMTMGHGTDLPILIKALPRQFPYVGCMGSRTKALALKKDLQGAGLAQEQMAQLYCPIGEPLGNSTPVEISLSITAQLLKIRDQKKNLAAKT